MAEWFVAKASDLPDGDRRIVVAGNNEIGVFHKGGAYYAYSNYCVHSGGPACEGLMINKVVDIIAADRTYQGQEFSDTVHFVCPWHGYEYELETGQCVGDRKLKLKKFDVVFGIVVNGNGADRFVDAHLPDTGNRGERLTDFLERGCVAFSRGNANPQSSFGVMSDLGAMPHRELRPRWDGRVWREIQT